MRGEIAYLKGFLSPLLFLDNSRVYRSLLSLYAESDTVHYEELLRNPTLLFVSLLWLVCASERGLGHLRGPVLFLAEERATAST